MNSKENIAGVCNLVQRSSSRNEQRERVGNDTGSGESGMKSSTQSMKPYKACLEVQHLS